MIPTVDRLTSFMNINSDSNRTDTILNSIYKSTLLDPIDEFLSRSKKGFRYELIQLAQEITLDYLNLEPPPVGNKTIQLMNDVIELLHSGSLIVDDIEDQSKMRRGQKTLHEIYGVPIALNAGNWLYFWPLVLLQNSKLPENIKNQAISECHHTLLMAHTGQALDLGTPLHQLEQNQVTELVLKTIELKSGALASLATKLGTLSAFANIENFDLNGLQQKNIFNLMGLFGSHFGQLLQYLDDIGNLTSLSNPQKKYEDLKLMRPSFLWAVIAQTLQPKDYNDFIKKISLSKESEVLDELVVKLNLNELALNYAIKYKEIWYQDFLKKMPSLSKPLKLKIHELLERLTHAY